MLGSAGLRLIRKESVKHSMDSPIQTSDVKYEIIRAAGDLPKWDPYESGTSDTLLELADFRDRVAALDDGEAPLQVVGHVTGCLPGAVADAECVRERITCKLPQALTASSSLNP
jgi:hypothetical protein